MLYRRKYHTHLRGSPTDQRWLRPHTEKETLLMDVNCYRIQCEKEEKNYIRDHNSTL